MEVHLLYQFNRGLWGFADATYFAGGHNTVNGMANNDEQASWRYGLSLTSPFDRAN